MALIEIDGLPFLKKWVDFPWLCNKEPDGINRSTAHGDIIIAKLASSPEAMTIEIQSVRW